VLTVVLFFSRVNAPPLGCPMSCPAFAGIRKAGQTRDYAAALNTPFKNASRSAFIVSASVVGMP
jgi:hypothetical protein